ncbi:MAG: T9SS C-terminal target domain-containing protein [Saprospirales bacterium]|nr:MAG: T9SS C-terminal target domain-containing protein [Saprospirales bacterium]
MSKKKTVFLTLFTLYLCITLFASKIKVTYELEYESCGTVNVESYYYRVNGTVDNCPKNIGGLDPSNFLNRPDLDGTSANVFPNPATNEIYFSIQNEAESYPENWDLKIMDQTGKVLKNSQLNFYNHLSDKVSLDLPQGTYIYFLKAADLNLNGKFIIK